MGVMEWGNPIIGADASIYWPPFDTNHTLKFNPNGHEYSWFGGNLAPSDNHIYAAPYDATPGLQIYYEVDAIRSHYPKKWEASCAQEIKEVLTRSTLLPNFKGINWNYSDAFVSFITTILILHVFFETGFSCCIKRKVSISKDKESQIQNG